MLIFARNPLSQSHVIARLPRGPRLRTGRSQGNKPQPSAASRPKQIAPSPIFEVDTMKRDAIRAFVAGRLVALGYPREWYEWPKHKPGRFLLLVAGDALAEFRVPAPMSRKKLIKALAKIPRNGPALIYKRVTVSSWRQPDLEEVWARAAVSRDYVYPRVDVRGHKGEAIEPPRRALTSSRRGS